MSTFVLSPLWIAGVFFYLVMKDGRLFRALGWAFVILFVVSMLSEAKTYYLAPIYPMLLAAGGVATEQFIARLNVKEVRPETRKVGQIPQLFADVRLGGNRRGGGQDFRHSVSGREG